VKGQPPNEKARARQLITQEIHRPFDLTRGPLSVLCSCGWLKLEHILLLTIHHIVYDGWSQGVLMQEFNHSTRPLRPLSLPPLTPVSALRGLYPVQREWMQGPAMQEQLAYWQRQLQAPLPHLDLSIFSDRPHPAVEELCRG